MTTSSLSSPAPTASSPGDALHVIDSFVDLSGEVCPFTFVRTKLAMEALPLGGTLRIVVDHEPAIRNIPRSAREWGQDVIGIGEHGPGRWFIDLRRRSR